MKYRLLILWLSLAWIIPSGSLAQDYERTEQISKSFEVHPQTSLEIYNKYGNIHLFPGESDSVRIDISIEVKANKPQKVDKLFDFINIDFSSTKYYIVSRTTFRQNQSSFWGEVSDLASTIFSGNNKVRIDYTVHLPQGIELKVENKFGNIYTTNHNGEVSIDLSNGDLKANDFKQLDLNLNFGNASIHNINKANIKTSYSELEINAINNLQYEGKSSTLNLEEVDEIALNSKRDKIKVRKINNVTGNLSFTYLDIRSLNSFLDLKSSYGGITIRDISTSCKSISIFSEYSDLDLVQSSQIAGKLDIKYGGEPVFMIPDSYNTKLTIDKLTEENYEFRKHGNIGRNPLGVKIVAKSGTISIKEN